MNIILVMFICSAIENKCQPIPLPMDNFNDHYDCAVYGYNYSHTLVSNLSREFVNKNGVYIKFGCNEIKKVNT
tara:strand:+ start:2101 stop:2319 length:219 start_codon:yes stop_codon:yes gene_type:complete